MIVLGSCQSINWRNDIFIISCRSSVWHNVNTLEITQNWNLQTQTGGGFSKANNDQCSSQMAGMHTILKRLIVDKWFNTPRDHSPLGAKVSINCRSERLSVYCFDRKYNLAEKISGNLWKSYGPCIASRKYIDFYRVRKCKCSGLGGEMKYRNTLYI